MDGKNRTKSSPTRLCKFSIQTSADLKSLATTKMLPGSVKNRLATIMAAIGTVAPFTWTASPPASAKRFRVRETGFCRYSWMESMGSAKVEIFFSRILLTFSRRVSTRSVTLQFSLNFVYLVYLLSLGKGVPWFAKIPATRSDFALRAFRTQSVLKGLNARQLAFSRRVSTRSPPIFIGGDLVSTGLPKC